jgi:hypothetical protein
VGSSWAGSVPAGWASGGLASVALALAPVALALAPVALALAPVALALAPVALALAPVALAFALAGFSSTASSGWTSRLRPSRSALRLARSA